MKEYLTILNNILTNGKWQDNRTGIKTLVLPNVFFEHNMSSGFPLLTTRRMPIKSISVELEGFIKGITSKKWYRERGCRFWDYWANPHEVNRQLERDYGTTEVKEDIRKKYQKEIDDLGALGYSHGWRRFGQAIDEDHNGILEGYDQFNNIIDTLKINPNDRRMVCSAWNPNDLDRAALPPCHLSWVLTHINGKLSLAWFQRSADLILGCGANIASYAMLLELICKETNMVPDKLSAVFCNCHIYENQLDGIKKQLLRKPKELPKLKINNWKGIYNWSHNDIELIDYLPYNKIDFPLVAI